MDKSNVVKSKSSNSAITTKSDNHSKKSRSNAEFQRNVVKKRGVYVEKKATNVGLHNTGTPRNKSVSPTPAVATPKAPPRPKAGQKRFLASVLTILSKSTAATQFPDDEAMKTKRKIDSKKKTPKKYRSKVLNDEMINHDQQKPLVVQYKNMNKTASNFSDTDSFKTRDIYSSKSNLLKSPISVMSSEAKGIVKEVFEGLQPKSKDVRIHEPVTQIEKINTSKKKGENDEKLYKFFVDLLETTFSVYNVKAQYDAVPNTESVCSSKVNFEIDESVVHKLENRKLDDDDSHKPHSYFVNDNIAGINEIPDLRKSKVGRPKDLKEVLPRPEHPKRMKTQSFVYNTKPRKVDPNQLQPLLFPTKKISRKTKKKTLMNLFKEQLNMSYSDYEEPQTLYEALRVMAKNKMKYQKAIRFDIPSTFSQECVFKQPKIISTKKSKKKNTNNSNGCPYDKKLTSKSFMKTDDRNLDERDSNETLEVYGYDYEVYNKNNHTITADEDSFLPNFPSEDDFALNPSDIKMVTSNQIEMYGPVMR